ncbi:DUF7793 family protein [Chitinimonas sp. JJ19]|uniref:DUF7793 family protein n=1 Tax=Chitinimonas sp. JJ19 TaxID=3109352 RepID=UPI003002EAC8
MQEAPYPYVWLGEDGILRLDYGRNPRIDLEAIQSALRQHVAISTVPRPVLVKGQGMVTSTAEAEDYAATPEVMAVTTAVALMQPTTIARIAAKLYLTYRRPPYPCRAFDREADAIDWLLQYVPRE